jgi:hypothetical protein
MKYSELKNLLKELDNDYREKNKIKQERIRDNLKALNKKAKELNKPIPDEVLVIVYSDQPVGIWFFEKYKEWL